MMDQRLIDETSDLRPWNQEAFVYVGTYTSGRSEGIYHYRMAATSGALKYVSMARAENPSFLAIDPQGRYLYAVNEAIGSSGRPAGAVTAFAIHPYTGRLAYLNQQPAHGGAPCHLSVDRTGRYVLTANYASGTLAVYPIQEDGRLGAASDIVHHRGHSVDPERQEGPHAHSITLDADNRFAFAADLGIDRIMIYQLDLSQGKLLPNDVPWVEVEAGAGPRHFDFHPNGRYAYLIRELDSKLTAYAYDRNRGRLDPLQTVSTLPGDFTGVNYCADVHVAPSGRFVYGSNRGHDSIAVFAIAEETGRLTAVGHQSTGGKTPRNFAIDPSGTFLLAANQDSDTIVTFRIDQQTGQLAPTGYVTQVPTPVCVKMIYPRMIPR